MTKPSAQPFDDFDDDFDLEADLAAARRIAAEGEAASPALASLDAENAAEDVSIDELSVADVLAAVHKSELREADVEPAEAPDAVEDAVAQDEPASEVETVFAALDPEPVAEVAEDGYTLDALLQAIAPPLDGPEALPEADEPASEPHVVGSAIGFDLGSAVAAMDEFEAATPDLDPDAFDRALDAAADPAAPEPDDVEDEPVAASPADDLDLDDLGVDFGVSEHGALEAFNPVGDLMADASAAFSDPVEVSIPRIAIHVFAERADTLAAAERAGQDRRLSRATTQIRVGGVEAALTAYQGEPTPPLIIIECLRDPATLLAEVDQLAEVCDAGTKVIVVGATNDIKLFRELMKRGVSEYLVAPVQPLQLISAIGGLFADPAQPFVGRTIAFVAARGGTGASSVAHNTAYAMSERIGANTVIVDYDLPFGTAGLDFNQDPLNGVADALSQPDRLDQVLLDRMMVRCTDKLSLFAAPATLDADWEITADAIEEVTTRIRGTAPFVVLDLPHVWSAWMRKTLISVDEVVVVATPDLASLRNAKNMVDLIKQARPNDAPPRLVLNQVGVPGRPEIPAKEFGSALGIHPSLSIPFDPKTFGTAANNGQMVLDAGPKTKAAEAFETLAQIVSRRELPVAGKPAKAGESKSMLAGLFKKKS